MKTSPPPSWDGDGSNNCVPESVAIARNISICSRRPRTSLHRNMLSGCDSQWRWRSIWSLWWFVCSGRRLSLAVANLPTNTRTPQADEQRLPGSCPTAAICLRCTWASRWNRISGLTALGLITRYWSVLWFNGRTRILKRLGTALLRLTLHDVSASSSTLTQLSVAN